jgi:ferredoxin-NADP reductase/ferredoxin
MTMTIWSRLTRLVATAFLPAHYATRAGDHVAARVEAVRAETGDITTLVVRPGRGWRRHRAGQHVRVNLELDGRIATRMYAIASAEDRLDGCIELTVEARGRVSRALASVEPGALLSLGLPEGDFLYVQGNPVPTLFVTEGIGLVPVMAMLRTFHARHAMPDIVHLHAGAELFADERRALAVEHPTYRAIDELPDPGTRETWACGAGELIDRVATVHVLRFHAVVESTGEGGLVKFGNSRIEARADGGVPLLRVAEDAGLAPPHGCRMGICHTCDVTLIAGRVCDLRTGLRIDEPGARIQICVCAAAGDVELAL